MSDSLQDLLDAWIAEELEENPVLATNLGAEGHDDRLPDLSADDVRRRERNDDTWLERFLHVDAADLSKDDGIDRDLVVSTLRGRQAIRDWEVWRRDPATYVGPALQGVFTLFLHRLHPEPELARLAAARLREVPRLVAEGRDNLEPSLAAPLFLDRAKAQVAAGIRYARELVPAEIGDAGARREVAAAGEVAAGALEGFLAHLEELAATASGEWAIGEARYSALLRDKEQLGYGAGEMRERGRAAYEEIAAEMTEVARRIDGSGDWRAVMERLNHDHAPTPDAMRDEYAAMAARARRFLHDTGIVTMPDGEECRVEPSPPFQRPVLAVASYSRPPAFRHSMTGTFFVPFPPAGTSDDEVQKRLETNSRASIPTITVHEAYPGHHWHIVTAQQNPRRVRSVVGTPYFTEGWALYAERLMREHGFFADDASLLAHLDARLFRAARIIVDTSLHMGEMSFDDAVAFMSTKASLSEPTARAEVGRYCSWPTQASSYLTGGLEIERIRARYLAEGRGDGRAFNDAIAGAGMLPIGLAERAVCS
ncbi:MAG TPA: DUF885 domain-containing protein [Acidimicrobiales bacterium]|nr:DUF885 domain-containing protein [Acidimicrobiales bacterium]